MPRLLADVEPLRTSRPFALLWAGQLLSQTGAAVRLVAVPYQIYILTGSTLAVGLLGLFQVVPLLAFSLGGGVIADRVDRRRLLLITQTCLGAVSATLAVATFLGIASVGLLYALTAVGSVFYALDQPPRYALAPGLVERRQIPASMALYQIGFQLATVVGSAVAGVVIASVGVVCAYVIDAGACVASTAAIAAMQIPRALVARAPVAPLAALRDGFRFLTARRLLLAAMTVDFFATFFGMTRAVMPYFADAVFHVGAGGLGLLYAAPGVGAGAVALTSGWTAGFPRKGTGILVSVMIFGLAVAAFGLLPASGFLAGLALLALAQGANTVSSIFRHTILQLETPDERRGRLSAINVLFAVGGPQLGQVESGIVSAILTPEIALISGGLACVAVATTAGWAAPDLRRYRARFEPADGRGSHAAGGDTTM